MRICFRAFGGGSVTSQLGLDTLPGFLVGRRNRSLQQFDWNQLLLTVVSLVIDRAYLDVLGILALKIAGSLSALRESGLPGA